MTDTPIEPPVDVTEHEGQPTPEPTPLPFDSVLADIKGESRSAKLMRVRDYIADSLQARHQTGENVINSLFIQRQRTPFASADARAKWLAGFQSWWRGRLSQARRSAASQRWQQSS